VAAIAAAYLDPHLTGRQVQVVMDDDHSSRIRVKPPQNRLDCMAAEIHKRLGLYEKHPRGVDPGFADKCLLPVVLPGARTLLSEFVNHSEAKVVALP
jgi:hypothetical protein